MKIKETRLLFWGRLRDFCIKHEYFTMGTNEEYDELYNMLPEVQYREGLREDRHTTAEDLLKVAEKIMRHSEPSKFVIMDLETLVFAICDECCTTTFQVEE